MASVGISGNIRNILICWYPDQEFVEIDNPLIKPNIVVKALNKRRPQRIFIESGTGVEMPLSAILWGAMLPIFIVSRTQIMSFAQSIKITAFDDDTKSHCNLLALFSEYSNVPDRQSLNRDSEKRLKSWVLRRTQLTEMREAEKRNKYRSSKHVASKVARHILWLTSEINQLDVEISAHIQGSTIWRVNERIKTDNAQMLRQHSTEAAIRDYVRNQGTEKAYQRLHHQQLTLF